VVAVAVSIVLPLAGCADDDDRDAPPRATPTSVMSFGNRTIDTWPAGDDSSGTVTRVSGVLRKGVPDPCVRIEADGSRHAVTWPPGSVRSDAGITVGSHMYRFDEKSTFTVIEDYKGPSRPVTCIATTAWMVVE